MKRHKNTGSLQLILSILVIVLWPLAGIYTNTVRAGGISSMTWTGTGITSSASAVSTPITPTLGFTLANAISSSDVLEITFVPQAGVSDNGVTLTANLASADITPGGGCSGTVTLAGSPISSGTDNPTLSITGLTCTTAASTLAFAASRFSTDTNAGNVTISITTQQDQGSIMYYIGNANQVTITATVDPILTLAIRNSADSADQAPGLASGPRTCNMGALNINTTPSGPSTNACQYRLRFSTNASSGLTLSYSSTSASSGLLAKDASTTIPNQPSGSSGDTLASNNGYGVQISTPAGLTRGATFGSTASNFYTITSTSSTTMFTSSAPFAPAASPDTSGTVLVTHGARIDNTQAVGNYSHTVTYTIAGSF